MKVCARACGCVCTRTCVCARGLVFMQTRMCVPSSSPAPVCGLADLYLSSPVHLSKAAETSLDVAKKRDRPTHIIRGMNKQLLVRLTK